MYSMIVLKLFKIKMKKSNSFSNMVNTKRLPLIIDT